MQSQCSEMASETLPANVDEESPLGVDVEIGDDGTGDYQTADADADHRMQQPLHTRSSSTQQKNLLATKQHAEPEPTLRPTIDVGEAENSDAALVEVVQQSELQQSQPQAEKQPIGEAAASTAVAVAVTCFSGAIEEELRRAGIRVATAMVLDWEDARARLAEVERRQRAARRAKRRAAKAANLAELALQDGPPPAHADGVTQPQSPHQLTASEIDALIPIEMGMCLPAPLQPATGDVDAAAAVHVPIDTPRDEMGGLLTSPREKSSNDAIIISNDGRDHEFVDGGGSELPSTAVRAESPAGQGEAAEVTQGVVDAHMHRDEVIMAPDASGSELATAAADHHQEVASDTKPAAANDREGIVIGEASSEHLDHIDGGEADKHDGSAAAEDGGSYTTAAEDDHDQLQ